MQTPTTAQELEMLASFVPERLLRRFARDPAPLSAPEEQRFEAAVLFADISGFSPLAERLAHRGPAGAEELTDILTLCFERLIGAIQEHGGDVVKFAGDAVLALWESAEHDLAAATQRAAQCALAVRRALHDYDVGGGTRLSVHSGVGAGEVTVAILGGQLQRWELLISGPPLLQIGRAGKQAGLGEVVVSAAAWEHLRACARGVALESGDWRLETIDAPMPPLRAETIQFDSGMEVALRACVPRAVLNRLGSGQDAWLAELRNLTVLFVNLPDLTEALPLKRAQAVMDAMQGALYRFEGSINQLGSDDKGIILLAALGLPPLSHEDDPLRALQAAQTLQARLRELGIRSAIGITTGRVYCGILGSSRRRQYAIIGDVVNLAARLMQIAPGDILCDTATYRATMAKMRFETLPPQTVKGKAQPVPLYRPYCHAVELPGRRPMFGRQAERSALTRALDNLKAQVGGVILVEGEAGIGKSRLVAEFVAEAEGKDLTVLTGAGDAVDKSTPYHAWRSVFAEVFAAPESHLDGKGAQRQQVLQHLKARPQWSRVAPLLNSVLPLDLPDNEITEQMTGEVRAENTNQLLWQILESEAQKHPLLLILEDAHWFDSASWALTLAVSQQSAPILLVIATRPIADPATSEYKRLLDNPHRSHLRLTALPPADVVTLIEQRLGVSTLPSSVAAFIQEKAQGNPFFSEELAYALRDSGVLLISNGQCYTAPDVNLSEVECPDSVEGVITSRMDRLNPSQILTLKVASVIGRVFALRILRDIYPIEPERAMITDCLTSLEKLDLTSQEPGETDFAYIFKHVITQQVAYNLLLFSQRRQLHRQVAEWYERIQQDDLSPYYPLLAHHWGRAEETEKAVVYLEKAGEQALRGGAYREAIEFLTDLVSTVAGNYPSSPSLDRLRVARWEQQLGGAYMNLGHLDESREHNLRALSILGYALPRGKFALTLHTLWQIAVQVIHFPFPSLFKLRPGEPDARLKIASECYERLGQIAYYAMDRLTGIHAAVRSLNIAENIGPSDEAARGYSILSIACGAVAFHRLAENYCRRAEDAGRACLDSRAKTWMLLLTGMSRSTTGRWTEAEKSLGDGIVLARRINDWRRWEESLIQLSIVALNRSKFQLAYEQAKEVFSMAQKQGNEQAQAWSLCVQAFAKLRLGDLNEAASLGELAGALRPQFLGNAELVLVHGTLAATRLWKGNLVLARQAADRGMRLIETTNPLNNYDFEAYVAILETYFAVWTSALESDGSDQQKALSDVLHANTALKRFATIFPAARCRSWIWEGNTMMLLNKSHAAFDRWTKARKRGEELDMPYETALAHFQTGRHLPLSEPQREMHLTKASDLFQKLDARLDLDRVYLVCNQRLVGGKLPGNALRAK